MKYKREATKIALESLSLPDRIMGKFRFEIGKEGQLIIKPADAGPTRAKSKTSL